MKLTRAERWILSNQFRILEALYPDEAESFQKAREVVEEGYELNYDWITQHISPDNHMLSDEECREIIDILAMFSALKDSYQNLTDASEIEEQAITFGGFDGNSETTQRDYVLFLVDREHKFLSLDRGHDFTSDRPRLYAYRRMLLEWRKSDESYELVKEDILRIVSAGYAENRKRPF
jgi:uncharacterized protein YfbU (UPF0304 family)